MIKFSQVEWVFIVCFFCQTFRVRNCQCNVSFTSVKSTKYKKFSSVNKNFLDLLYEPRRVSFDSVILMLFSDHVLLQNLFHYFFLFKNLNAQLLLSLNYGFLS